MRYLVVSDSHGNREILEDIAKQWESLMTAMFHCGDSELSTEDKIWESFFVVGGNMDFDPSYPATFTQTFEDDTIFMTHGHLYGINFSFERLDTAAKEAKANICLFGHLHRVSCEEVDNIIFVNPGSISQPRGPIQEKCYCIFTSRENSYDVQYYNDRHEPITELHFMFKK